MAKKRRVTPLYYTGYRPCPDVISPYSNKCGEILLVSLKDAKMLCGGRKGMRIFRLVEYKPSRK